MGWLATIKMLCECPRPCRIDFYSENLLGVLRHFQCEIPNPSSDFYDSLAEDVIPYLPTDLFGFTLAKDSQDEKRGCFVPLVEFSHVRRAFTHFIHMLNRFTHRIHATSPTLFANMVSRGSCFLFELFVSMSYFPNGAIS